MGRERGRKEREVRCEELWSTLEIIHLYISRCNGPFFFIETFAPSYTNTTLFTHIFCRWSIQLSVYSIFSMSLKQVHISELFLAHTALSSLSKFTLHSIIPEIHLKTTLLRFPTLAHHAHTLIMSFHTVWEVPRLSTHPDVLPRQLPTTTKEIPKTSLR